MSDWYYLEGDVQKGPYSDEDVSGLIKSDRITLTTYVYREGLADWQLVSETELSDLFSESNATGEEASQIEDDSHDSGEAGSHEKVDKFFDTYLMEIHTDPIACSIPTGMGRSRKVLYRPN